MIIKPTENRVLILPDEVDEKTAGGIIIPGKKDEQQSTTGKVVDVGPGIFDHKTLRHIPMMVEKDQKVVFRAFAGSNVKIDGVEHFMMREQEIEGVIYES